MKQSIYIVYPDKETFYTGKIIDKTYYRNLKFNNSVLWSEREFGLNVEILDYLKEKEIKNIVYIDTAKRDRAFRITVKKYDQEKILREFKYGKQYFVKVGAANPLKKIPKLPFVRQSIYIKSKAQEDSDNK